MGTGVFNLVVFFYRVFIGFYGVYRVFIGIFGVVHYLLLQWINFIFFWLVLPLELTKNKKFKLFLLGKLTR